MLFERTWKKANLPNRGRVAAAKPWSRAERYSTVLRINKVTVVQSKTVTQYKQVPGTQYNKVPYTNTSARVLLCTGRSIAKKGCRVCLPLTLSHPATGKAHIGILEKVEGVDKRHEQDRGPTFEVAIVRPATEGNVRAVARQSHGTNATSGGKL